MNLGELKQEVARRHPKFYRADIDLIVDAWVDAIMLGIENNKTLYLPGAVSLRAGSMMKNMNLTNREMPEFPQKTLRMKVSASLRRKINPHLRKLE